MQEQENVTHVIKILLLLDCTLPGYYGENCSTPCPVNCLDGLCDTVNGTCNGCLDGYSGSTCSEGYSHLLYSLLFPCYDYNYLKQNIMFVAFFDNKAV